MFALSENSWIQLTKGAVPCTEEEFSALWEKCPVVKDKIKMYGKTMDLPRFQRLYGEASYSYSGIHMEPNLEIPPLVERCLEFARAQSPAGNWNGILVNWYPDGASCVGMHADKEPDLKIGEDIFSFSFGAEREFVVEANNPKTADVKKISFQTKNGSCLVMGGDMQKEFKHGVPKTKETVGPRINVTVRSFNTGREKRQKMSS